MIRFIKKHLKFIFQLTIISGLFFMFGFFYTYHLPKIENWMMIEIENYSQNNLPIKVWPKKLNVSFFPLGLDVEEIKFKPKESLSEVLAPGVVKKIQVELSLLQLIRGRIRVSTIKAYDADLKLIIKDYANKQKSQFTQKKWSEILKTIYNLPIDRLELNKINILSKIEKLQTSASIKNLNATLENRYETLKLDLSLPSITLKETNKTPRIKLFIETKLLFDDSNIKLSALKLRKQNTFLVATGDLSGSYVEGDIDQYRVQARTQIETKSLIDNIKLFMPSFSKYNIKGVIAGEINLSQPKNERPQLSTNIKSENLILNSYEIGNTKLVAKSTKQLLNIDRFDIQNSSGSATLKNAKMQFNEQYSFSSDVNIHQLEVAQLLRTINVGSTPLVVNLNANLPCKGVFYPDFKLNCDGAVNIDDLWVYSGKNKSTIVKALGFKLNGGFQVDNKQVEYNSQIKIGDSIGSSKGVINYKNGFNIKYTAKKINFKDIKNLANLKLEGSGSLSGTTKGNSKTATMSLKLNGKDVWLQDYLLGDASSRISYKKSILSFKNLKSTIDSTQYQGEVNINLSRKTIQLQAKSNYLNSMDLIKSFNRKINFNLPITGTGQASLTAQGPLDFSKLSYDLYSQIYRGTIYDESYDVLQVSIRSTKGLVNFSNSYLKKGKGQAFITGNINTNGIADLKIQGENFKLKEIDHLRRKNLEIGGDLSFSSNLKGPILDPNYNLNSEFKEVTVFDEKVDDSKIVFGVDKKHIYTKGDLLGNKINFDINYPFNQKDEFYLKAKTNNWNFTKYLALIATDDVQRTFNSNVTSTINLSSGSGGIKKSSGFINVDNFFIQRGNIMMSNPETMRIIFTDGVIETESVSLAGDEAFVTLESSQKTATNLNLTAKAKIPMGLLAIVLPVSDISGKLSGSVNLTGPYSKLKIVGSSFIEDGFFAISGFPHAFNNISADILFNEKNILINSINGKLAGGNLTGSGKMQLLGINNIPVNLNLDVNNASFEVPTGFNTHGNAKIQVVGSWFPYTLKGKYIVNKGLVTKSFIESNGEKSKQIQPSTYLPQYLKRQSFQPLRLDLKVTLQQPVVIKNPEADARVSGEVLLQAFPDKPLLSGQLQIERGGQITFRDNEFDILSAYIEYNKAPPEQPKLYVSAKTQITSDDITYDINLILQGTATSPTFKLSSTPPLEEVEIVSLLALGITPSQLDERVDPSEQATQTSYQLGTALLSSPLGKEIKNRFGVDVKISSGFDEVDKKSVPTVTVKKQFTDDLSAQASRTIEQVPRNNVKMKYNINQNLSVIGLWDSSESNLAEPEKDTTSDTIGVDLEYKIRFK